MVNISSQELLKISSLREFEFHLATAVSKSGHSSYSLEGSLLQTDFLKDLHMRHMLVCQSRAICDGKELVLASSISLGSLKERI